MIPRQINLVEGFRHSTPYINSHRGKTFVLMLSGESIADENFPTMVNDIGLLHSLGIRLIVVYGARPQIDNQLHKCNLLPAYHKHTRITDATTLEQIKQAAGQLQLDITASLSMSLNNTPLQGAHLNVVSGNFIIAQPIGVDEGVDYCHSGRIRRIDHQAINYQLNNNAIVLLGPVAVSVTGESFNLSAEEIATQVSIKLKATKMIGFCQEQGLVDSDGSIISELLPHEAEDYLQRFAERDDPLSGSACFLRGAILACRAGIPRCHLLSYQENGAMIQELFSREGIGTQIVMASAEQLRSAKIEDIGGILDLIQPLEREGILVRRSREQLEMEIGQFTVIVRDNLPIACAALYLYRDEKIGEMGCMAVHPDYRNSSRGDVLLKKIISTAKKKGLEKLFVLTTRSLHWFQERGFVPVEVDALPLEKQKRYNKQRRSKVLMMSLTNDTRL